ncbi:MAG: nitrilase-related carbon-nitrogen hydrolase, partial [Candidatus Paceibacteria bacterium]
NGVFTCAVNRTGIEGKIHFWGGSFVCDAFGTILARAGKREKVLIVEADLRLGKRVKEGWHFLENRRPECYTRLVSNSDPPVQHAKPTTQNTELR